MEMLRECHSSRDAVSAASFKTKKEKSCHVLGSLKYRREIRTAKHSTCLKTTVSVKRNTTPYCVI